MTVKSPAATELPEMPACGTFTLLIGPEKKEFKIKTDFFDSSSKPLATLMNGKWKEGKEKIAELPDVEAHTFTDALRFLTTGEYAVNTFRPPPRSMSLGSLDFPNARYRHSEVVLKWMWLKPQDLHCCMCGRKTPPWKVCDIDNACKACLFKASSKIPYQYCCFCNVKGDPTTSSFDECQCKNIIGCSPCHIPSHALELVFHFEVFIDEITRLYAKAPQEAENERSRFCALGEVFDDVLHHCKVYVFAETFDIENLRRWALCSIWILLTLIGVELDVEDREVRRRHIVEYIRDPNVDCTPANSKDDDRSRPQADVSPLVPIVQFVVANTRLSTSLNPQTSSTDDLCWLLTSFMTYHNVRFAQMKDFQDLLDDNANVKNEILLSAMRQWCTQNY